MRVGVSSSVAAFVVIGTSVTVEVEWTCLFDFVLPVVACNWECVPGMADDVSR